jgi:hypothetical protein
VLAHKSLGGSAASDHLHLMRGSAAILVMLGHLRNRAVRARVIAAIDRKAQAR